MVSIRKIIIDDLKEVLEIENLSFNDPWTKKMFEEEIKNGDFYVVVENERILGYLGFTMVCNEASLVNFAIHPSYRRKGIGTKILRYLINIAKEKKGKKIFLEVRKSNISAISFYKKHKFREVGIRKGYYGTDEDAIIMACEL